ncbi:putative peroxidase 48 [Quercus suber]|uniref:Peroxidase 48 n=1 Tax=Quercus suber TaxID=58331 RepID=A0AAW0LPY6_QUESU
MTRKIDRSRSKEREKHKGDPNDRSTLRIDFARAKMKMSGHNVLTQSQGKVRRNQSLLLLANEKTARLVRAYASDDRSTARLDFAWAMMKIPGNNVLDGSQGQVQRNCSLPFVSS